MTFDRWQAPDRDSPATIEFAPNVELGRQLQALMLAEGRPGTREDVILEVTGQALSRPRRWHKIFERMGLLFQNANGNTELTDLGVALRSAEAEEARDFRRRIAKKAISVLRKYQLRNPADSNGDDSYPVGTDIHPYWAIWKAAVELGGRLHWDELNRELMWVLTHSELDGAIARIRQARSEAGYDPVTGGGGATRLRARAYDQITSPDDRDPAGQVRDQKTTPWFKRAGLGELLLSPPGRAGNGYWTIHPDVYDLLEADAASPPQFVDISDEEEWFAYYGRIDAEPAANVERVRIGDSKLMTLLLDRQNVILYGPPGTGKTHAAFELADAWVEENGDRSVFRTTFHPSYGYEDFVLGFRPSGAGNVGFALKEGVLLLAAKRAIELQETGKAVLILIDEVNRGDVARIFGELITYIERDKRDVEFLLSSRPEEPFRIPRNIYFLGTMNTADKSISLLDVAMRRRFAFVDFPADPSAFAVNQGWLSSVAGASLRLILEQLNKRLEDEGIESDRSIGHAILRISIDRADPLSALREIFEYDVIPLINEYCYMDRPRIKRVLGGLVNESGKISFTSDAEFEHALVLWLGASFSTEPIPEA